MPGLITRGQSLLIIFCRGHPSFALFLKYWLMAVPREAFGYPLPWHLSALVHGRVGWCCGWWHLPQKRGSSKWGTRLESESQQIIDLFASKNLNHNGFACKIVPLISGWVPLDEIHWNSILIKGPASDIHADTADAKPCDIGRFSSSEMTFGGHRTTVDNDKSSC